VEPGDLGAEPIDLGQQVQPGRLVRCAHETMIPRSTRPPPATGGKLRITAVYNNDEVDVGIGDLADAEPT